ncbi:hypothetical protein J7T55_004849 [Diaporthe amygdali]|uniref:uncharacterized protein n=1 Tax=Phomopsis amygdali TaxID=1214568 RepID=UPI0022FE963B|nr:uncharacterized protein J7T55_004849 [Diaporthe amygdali]KAJ0114605.1 hypothetical protein J7T55_004849 [Diaporthe amygdali]
MHQQPNTKDCASEAIGGAHYGPVQVYLAKVSDAASAVGSSAGWFKIFADTWAKNPSGSSGDDDYWGTKDLTTCCGRMNVKIPTDIAPGDYLLRAEALALHTAGSSGGAQFYMTCYQITVTGSGSASPATVKLPGAYAASDAGILVDIHARIDQERRCSLRGLRVNLCRYFGPKWHRSHSIDDSCSHNAHNHFQGNLVCNNDECFIGRWLQLRSEICTMWRPGLDRRYVLRVRQHLLCYQPGRYAARYSVNSSHGVDAQLKSSIGGPLQCHITSTKLNLWFEEMERRVKLGTFLMQIFLQP